MDIGGRDLTHYLMKLLREKQLFETTAEREIVRDMKEKLCFVAEKDFETQLQTIKSSTSTSSSSYSKSSTSTSTSTNQTYELPDGNEIRVGDDVRMMVGEALFDPKRLSFEGEFDGIHQMAFQAIQAAQIDCRSDLYHNICISGGSTMFAGIAERLNFELTSQVCY